MPLSRDYSSTAKPRQLSGDVTAAATTITVTNTGVGTWPALPFTAVLERGTPSEELVLVTATAANVDPALDDWTVTRGYDGTTAAVHAGGTPVEHVTAAVDMRQFRDGTHKIDSTDPLGINAARAPRSYPVGYSRMYVTETGGWPHAWGWVETLRQGSDVLQRYSPVIEGEMYWRTAYSNADAWGPWRRGAYLTSGENPSLIVPPGSGDEGGQIDLLGGGNGTAADWAKWSIDVYRDVYRILREGSGEMVNIDAAGRMYVRDGLRIPDTRAHNPHPNTFTAGAGGYATRWDFKNAADMGLSAQVGHTHIGVQTFSPWGDDSGGGVYQLAFAPNGMFVRYGTRAGGWLAWRRIQDSSWGGDPSQGGYESGMNNASNQGNDLSNLRSHGAGFYDSSGPGTPTGNWNVALQLKHYNRANEYGHQIAGDMFGPRVHSRELNNGGWGAWKELGHAARGSYTGNGLNDRHIGLGFDPKTVVVFNRDYNYFHLAHHFDGLGSSTGQYMTNGNVYTSSDQGYRPYIVSLGFRINASILNDNARIYDFWAVG